MSPASYQTAPPRVAVSSSHGLRRAMAPAVRPGESGKRDSNPRPQPWQGCALPTELFPRKARRRDVETARRIGVRQLLSTLTLSPLPTLAYQPLSVYPSTRLVSGGEGDRTPDLVNAIHALSQLSYAPRILGPAKRVPAGTRHLTGTFQWCQAISRPGTNFSSCGRYHRLIRDHTDAQAHSTEEDHLPRPGEAPNGAPPHGGGGRGGARGQGEARQEARAAPGASGRTRHP